MKIGRKKIFVISLIIAVSLTFIFLFTGNQNVIQLYHHNKLLKAKESQLSKAKQTIDSLKTEIARLKSDTAYLERIAREKLGMARKDEKVFKFVNEQE